jgi:hypothetical protein
VTDPAARQVRNYKVPGDAANQAEIKKISEYDDWNLVGSRNVASIPFAVETFGAIGDQAFKLLKDSLGKSALQVAYHICSHPSIPRSIIAPY